MKNKIFDIGITFESDTVYISDRKVYDIFPSDNFEEIHCWWTCANSGNIPLQAAFVLKNLKNVTIDLGGAKLVFHGRIMPFAVSNCENIVFKNFSVDYDRPYFTQGKVLESENNSVVIEIPKTFGYRIEGHDFIAVAENWEHKLVNGNMLFRCMNAETKRPSENSDVILGLIGDNVTPSPNPPIPIHHLYAENLGEHRVKISNFPNEFKPRVGEILAMTHEDRRKHGFLLEECRDVFFENIRLLHIGAMGVVANLCHNLSFNNFSMYLDEETEERIITINADSIHCFHCTGLIKVENCRFENMLDDAINVHGNYLVCEKQISPNSILVKNCSAILQDMKFLLPNDDVVIYKENTQEINQKCRVKMAEFIQGQNKDMIVEFADNICGEIKKGDILENQRMPELEVRNCIVKCMNGFRISTGKRTLIENCQFETAGFSVLFSGDMSYWYENGPVKDVTIKNCTFIDCGFSVRTDCW